MDTPRRAAAEGSRPAWLVGLAIALVVIGTLRGARALAMAAGAVPAMSLVALLVQCVCALAAGAGLWRRRPWTLLALAGLGVGVVLQAAAETFLYEIAPLLPALAVTLGAIALLLAIGVLVASELEPAAHTRPRRDRSPRRAPVRGGPPPPYRR
jgi:hypothetical protein